MSERESGPLNIPALAGLCADLLRVALANPDLKRQLARELSPYLFLPVPGPISLTFTERFTGMAGKSVKVFDGAFPVPPRPEPNDIGRQILRLTVDGTPRPEVEVPLDPSAWTEAQSRTDPATGRRLFYVGEFKEGQSGTGEFLYEDSSRRKNLSPVREFAFTVEDTEGPAQPGEITFAFAQKFVDESEPVDGEESPPAGGEVAPDAGPTPGPGETETPPSATGELTPGTEPAPPVGDAVVDDDLDDDDLDDLDEETDPDSPGGPA